ncbi:uncharacterized protein [Palaemon carinicauda]|uniref:uncharacterized protein n=1 Tax=Palaemon carinicauda TaxID=392227 RepID=UPI0035B5923A
MKVLVAVVATIFVAVECSDLQSYSLPNKEFTSITHHGGYHGNQGYQYLPPTTACADGQVLHVDGRCVTPVITRSVYLFNVPQLPRRPTPLPYIPPPKIDHNILFVRLPETLRGPDPIVVPPPQQKNIVYVLKKKTQDDGPRVIEVPAPPKTNPDVYFVGYDQGENPILPTGEDLQSVLAHNAQEIYGQVVDTGSSGHIIDGSSHSHVHIGSIGSIGSGTHFEVPSVGNILPGLAGAHHGVTGLSTSNSLNQGIVVTPINSYLPPDQYSQY